MPVRPKTPAPAKKVVAPAKKGKNFQQPKVPHCPECFKEHPGGFAGQWVACTCPASSVRLAV